MSESSDLPTRAALPVKMPATCTTWSHFAETNRADFAYMYNGVGLSYLLLNTDDCFAIRRASLRQGVTAHMAQHMLFTAV